MRIGYYGDGGWAQRALERLLASAELDVCFVVGRHGSPDRELRAIAEEAGLPFLTDVAVNRSGFVDRVRSFEPDIQASMSFDQIVGSELRGLADLGFVNCHAGALPFYRGRNVLNWVLINGENRLGITVHYMDAGIDTGDIIRQEFVGIGPDDDYADLLAVAEDLCAKVLYNALLDLARGSASRVKQGTIHPVGFYSSRRREGDEWIEWSWSSKRIHDFVRGIAPPGPGARATLEGDRLAILETELIPEAPAYIDRPGTVVGTGDGGCVVKTGNTTIRVTKVADFTEDSRIGYPRSPELTIGQALLGKKEYRLEELESRLSELKARVDEREDASSSG